MGKNEKIEKYIEDMLSSEKVSESAVFKAARKNLQTKISDSESFNKRVFRPFKFASLFGLVFVLVLGINFIDLANPTFERESTDFDETNNQDDINPGEGDISVQPSDVNMPAEEGVTWEGDKLPENESFEIDEAEQSPDEENIPEQGEQTDVQEPNDEETEPSPSLDKDLLNEIDSLSAEIQFEISLLNPDTEFEDFNL